MVTREDNIEQSVEDFAKDILNDRGYTVGVELDFRDSFPYGATSLPKPIVAAGFNFDDDGAQAEMGSDLKVRIHTIEFFVIGTTLTWARNVANVLKFGLEAAGTIPLLDYSVDPAEALDTLIVDGVLAHRQVVAEPEAWQEFIYTTTLRVEDVYYANLAA